MHSVSQTRHIEFERRIRDRSTDLLLSLGERDRRPRKTLQGLVRTDGVEGGESIEERDDDVHEETT